MDVNAHTDTGSSPLARGLPVVVGTNPPVGGIIPARAGFTSSYDLKEMMTEDHPRSRGVYANINVTSLAAAGSSPLARGLLRLQRG